MNSAEPFKRNETKTEKQQQQKPKKKNPEKQQPKKPSLIFGMYLDTGVSFHFPSFCCC